MAEDHAAVLKVRARRHRDLARSRNQVACRLHAVLCDLVPGGHRKEITAARAATILGQVSPASAVATARVELAAAFLEDLRRLDAQLRATNKKLAAVVRAPGNSITEVFGIGPVNGDTVIGDVRHVSRFPGRDHFASWNGTAPVEVSSGDRKTHRLSLKGNRRVNHAIPMTDSAACVAEARTLSLAPAPGLAAMRLRSGRPGRRWPATAGPRQRCRRRPCWRSWACGWRSTGR